ncbi:MAG: sigma-70 family RNA polymerase sigma factor [Planctomycetia bacterium]|nr:sigma-70 family RNA polymerase sigma factor [Planctomycetia bacterium]
MPSALGSPLTLLVAAPRRSDLPMGADASYDETELSAVTSGSDCSSPLENLMPHDDEFSELFERVCRGDADAACAIVRRYESAIRVAVRTRLSDPALRRQFDSMDVCQSVLASFFLRAATGAYDLREPRQLMALLTKMARNKLAMHVRGQHRQCRDVRRSRRTFVEQADVVSSAPDPMRHAVSKELLHRALGMMSVETRAIAERRFRGESWSDVASGMGGTADGRRKQYERAVDCIADVLDVRADEG